ncbi:hypothetical protein [Flavobacterium chilense]|uniref:Glycosyl transferase family 2 n=2 Tax=Flavobacterium chilense TaxID=946677 RepID=A0A1M7ET66_9FLAO|nr:hypothetical protein [Flavobacterium chilense]SHL94797.1 hypothetical protein SAMN05444484_10360 [Flavobacterium chilense]
MKEDIVNAKIVYICSYFNGNSIRKSYFARNIALYTKLGYNIIVCWMNKEEDLIIQENIRYINSKIVNASTARNKLLKLFYKSEYREALFSDDDTIILNNAILEKPIGTFDILSYIINLNNRLLDKPIFLSGIFKIKNLRLNNKKMIFFDETLESNQDVDFGYNANHNEIKIKNVFTKDIFNDQQNSVMFSSKEDREKKKEQSIKIIIKKWNNYGKHISPISYNGH